MSPERPEITGKQGASPVNDEGEMSDSDETDEPQVAAALPRTTEVHWLRDSVRVTPLVDACHTWPGKLLIGFYWLCWWGAIALGVYLIPTVAATIPVEVFLLLLLVVFPVMLWLLWLFVRGLRDFRFWAWFLVVTELPFSIIGITYDQIKSETTATGLITSIVFLGLFLLFFRYLLKRRRDYGWYLLKEALGFR